MSHKIAVLGLGLALAGTACTGRPCDGERGFGHRSCTPWGETAWRNETGVVPPPNPGWDPSTGILADWGTSGLSIRVEGLQMTGMFFGMAETAADAAGWYREDCLDFACHQFSGRSGNLVSVDDIDDVIPGETTLFDDDGDGPGDAFTADDQDRLTYLLQFVGGPLDGFCYIWGDDVGYYAGEGCETR